MRGILTRPHSPNGLKARPKSAAAAAELGNSDGYEKAAPFEAAAAAAAAAAL